MTQIFLRIADVCRVTGLPRATIYEMVSKGAFPKRWAGSRAKYSNGKRLASQHAVGNPMPSKDDEAPADKRSVRRQHLCKHLHAAGQRPTLEALIAVENGQPLDDVLEDFARVPSNFYRIVGASSFARILSIFTRSSR